MSYITVKLITTYGGRDNVTLKWHEESTSDQYDSLQVSDIASLPTSITAYHCGDSVTLSSSDINEYSYTLVE